MVEAAGNGAENLEDEIYQNKFNRSHRDSGAILLGAGAPPPVHMAEIMALIVLDLSFLIMELLLMFQGGKGK